MNSDLSNTRIGIVGLGYVGLPLAVAFGRRFDTTGFDINPGRIGALRAGTDSTLEVTDTELAAASRLRFSADADELRGCDVFIATVPTPIDRQKRPDLKPLESASELIGSLLQQGNTVIYESTVYPGATEEVCVPILEQRSGLVFNRDFYAGYSPERINPGDREHRLETIVKITAGSTPEAADFVDRLYAAIVDAGTHRASSIRVAEAAKVIENTQRDVNIALINELAMIFNRLGIDTEEVLRASGTKWNFLPFRPGLVGGHCIGVDPYYLTHKSEEVGYHPEMILAGRRINDNMGNYVVVQVMRRMLKRRIHVSGSRVLVMGLTFKENCPDVRNTRVVDMVREFRELGTKVDVHDPWVDPKVAQSEYGIELTATPAAGAYDAIVLAVAHRQFVELGIDAIRALGKPEHVVFDIKSIFPADAVDGRL